MPKAEGGWVSLPMTTEDKADFDRVKAHLDAAQEQMGVRGGVTNTNVLRFCLMLGRRHVEAWEAQRAPGQGQ